MLSRTWSTHIVGEVLTKMPEGGRAYLEGIPPSQWRNTAWLDDPSLPPRYGIRTSNMSEATNSMFDDARDVSWLHCLDTILTKIVTRIGSLRQKHKDKTGVVEKTAGIVRKRWDASAGLQVT